MRPRTAPSTEFVTSAAALRITRTTEPRPYSRVLGKRRKPSTPEERRRHWTGYSPNLRVRGRLLAPPACPRALTHGADLPATRRADCEVERFVRVAVGHGPMS